MADDRERDTERTIVTRDGNGRSGAVVILIVAVIVLLLAILFFAGAFNRDDQQDLNVDVNTPDVNVIVPPTQLPPLTPMPEGQSPQPNVNVNVTTPPPEPVDNLSNTANTVSNSG